MRRFTFLVLTMLLPLLVTAQENQAEQLLSAFENNPTAGAANRFFDLLDKEQITDKHIQFAASTNPDTLKQQVWYWAAEYYLARQDYERGTHYGKKALPYCQTGNNRSVESDCLSCLAICQYRIGNFKTAIEYAKKCNELDLKEGNPDNISSSYNTMAGIFISSHQIDEAENCVLKGLEYGKKADNPQRLTILLGMACEIYNNKGHHQKALPYGQQALEMEYKLQRKEKIAIRQSQIAESLIGLKRYHEAKDTLTQAIRRLQESNNQHSLGIACNQMGRILLVENNQKKAADYFNKALQIFMTQKDFFNESRSRRGLYEALKLTDPRLAIEHNDRYNSLRASIFDEESRMMLSRYAAMLGNERLQDKNNELQQTLRHNLYAAGAVFLLFAIATAAFIYWRHRNYRKRMMELTDEIANIRRQKTEEKDSPQNTKTDMSDQQFLSNVITTANDSMRGSQLSVEEIARNMGMGTATFRRRLQQLTGETPKAYITAIQMQKAASLLASGKHSINEVALVCGFMELSSFSRTFKRIYGVTPSQYVQGAG